MKLLILLLCLFSFNVFAEGVVFKPIINQSITVAMGSVQVLPVNKDRKFLLLQNKAGPAIIFIKVDSIHTGTEGYELRNNEELRFEGNVPINSIWAKANSDSPTLVIMEGI